jgi:hypothetical protein
VVAKRLICSDILDADNLFVMFMAIKPFIAVALVSCKAPT